MKKLLVTAACAAGGIVFAYAENSIETLIQSGKLKVNLTSLGGHRGDCVEAEIENLTADSLEVTFEAGRRLVAGDSSEQDIFLVKENSVKLAPKENRKRALFGFCCQSHDHSPKKGGKFSIGFLAPIAWLKLATIINKGDYDESAVQQAVWAISNNHPTASIPVGIRHENYPLIATVAGIKGEPIPWYFIQYAHDPDQLFSNVPVQLKGQIKYEVTSYGVVTISVTNENAKSMQTIEEIMPKMVGKRVYRVNLNVYKWPHGKYTVTIQDHTSAVLARKTFEI
ncbi:MAG: hypothetical protein KG003_11150 [Bacteroidetes bacterium]|nr:hypothetical protein [Bacteroidota bacterium]